MENEFIYPFDENIEEEVKQSEEDSSTELPPEDIVAFNELRSCADIFRMYKTKQLDIQPYFQREIVWKNHDQTRFIDSLIKQLPIPSMCFSYDFDSDERYVIDGLQRIQSIVNFLSMDNWTLSTLTDIDKKISGKTIKSIRRAHPSYYSRVQNLMLPITVIRCKHNDKRHLEYLFTIFHRLNSGGSKLNNQEIRNCIYSGSFNEFLKTSVKNDRYRLLFNIDSNKKYRFAFEELNLRFFALSAEYETYTGRLSKWLNDYMYKNRFMAESQMNELWNEFEIVINLIHAKIFSNEPIGNTSKAIIEAVYVGIQRNLNRLIDSKVDLRKRYIQLRKDKLFSVDELKEGVAQKSKVLNRLNRAVEIFR